MPGWYAGRTVHIHTKPHTGGTVTPAGYRGGHTCHTGQLYFTEALTAAQPYTANPPTRTTVDADSLYDATGGLLSRLVRAGVPWCR